MARTCDEHSLQVRDRWCLLASLSYNEATFRKWPTSMEDKLNMDSFINLILRVPSKYSLIEIPSKRDLGENEFMKSVLGRTFICYRSYRASVSKVQGMFSRG